MFYTIVLSVLGRPQMIDMTSFENLNATFAYLSATFAYLNKI